MIGLHLTLVFIFMILVTVHTASIRNRRSTVPLWHTPCGASVVPSVPAENVEVDLQKGLKVVSVQHQIMLLNYLYSDYEYLYERARRGVQKHQYIPTWVPGRSDIRVIKKLINASSEKIADNLPKLHTDLQKFAVAFEELIEDSTSDKLNEVLQETQSCLLMTLCEVESTLWSLPSHQVPNRIQRSIMSDVERNPVDDTRRMVRDWGILLKYKDYLHAWRHVFNY